MEANSSNAGNVELTDDDYRKGVLDSLKIGELEHSHPTIGPNAEHSLPHKSQLRKAFLDLQAAGEIKLLMKPDGQAVWVLNDK